MADLDVSDAINDSNLSSSFDVIRRKENISDKGRMSTDDQRICDVEGVVCEAGPNDLERLDDQQRMGRHISVVTQFALRGPARGRSDDRYQPDLIFWQGDYYVIHQLDPYPQYGSGFMQAIAGSIDYNDRATPAQVVL